MSRTVLDLTGRRFGRLVVVSKIDERHHANVIWECVCDCGTRKNVPSPYLRSGNTTSCGCLKREQTIHMNREREYALVERGPCARDACEEMSTVGVFCHSHYHQDWAVRNPDKRRAYQRKSQIRHKYGLTVETYDALVQAQDGKCAICKRPPTSRRLFVDHDHACCPEQRTCGKCLRGLLCNNCNFLIGLAQEDQDTLRRAADYLADWSTK